MPSSRHAPTTSTILSAPLPSAWLVMRRSYAGVKCALGMTTTTMRIRPATAVHSALLHPVRPAVLCCAHLRGSADVLPGAIRFGTTASARLVPAVGCARLSFGSAGYSTRYGSAEN